MSDKLPKKWISAKLGEIADWGSGGTPKSTIAEYYNGDIPWLVIGDLNDSIVTDSNKSITKGGLENSSAKLVDEGALLIAMYGSIGKLGIAGRRLATNQAIAFTKKIYGGISTKYLFYYLLFKREELLSLGKGGAQQNISQTVLKEVVVSISPVNEQKRIADKLDEAFNNIGNIKPRIDNIPNLFEEFRKVVLQKAAVGELTKKWRLKRNIGEWTEISSSQIFEIVTSGSRGWAKYYDSSGEQLFVRITNMDYGTYELNLEVDKLQFLKLPENTEGKRTLLKARDILISITGDVGMISLIPENFEYEAYVNQHVCLARPIMDVNEKFIVYYLMSENGFGQFQEKKRGATKAGLTLKDIRSLHITIPSRAEQDEIVKRIDELFNTIKSVESKYESVKNRIDDLPNQLLAKAFKGELVPPDPDDEPAEVLLERIKSEIEKLNSSKQKRR